MRRRRKQPGENPGERKKSKVHKDLRGPVWLRHSERGRTGPGMKFMDCPQITQPGHLGTGQDNKLAYTEHWTFKSFILWTFIEHLLRAVHCFRH